MKELESIPAGNPAWLLQLPRLGQVWFPAGKLRALVRDTGRVLEVESVSPGRETYSCRLGFGVMGYYRREELSILRPTRYKDKDGRRIFEGDTLEVRGTYYTVADGGNSAYSKAEPYALSIPLGPESAECRIVPREGVNWR